VLFTGKDFLIIDFEGEPARSLSERRSKKSPLRDVAGMIRSFHYASYASMLEQEEGADPLDLEEMEPWRELWYKWNSLYFLHAYLETCGDAFFMPKDREEIDMLLDAYVLEKAMYELGYELNNRPDWIQIPLEGILEIVER
jgi:maltose alpha-D-glucosyltransferase/alpha-amylase